MKKGARSSLYLHGLLARLKRLFGRKADPEPEDPCAYSMAPCDVRRTGEAEQLSRMWKKSKSKLEVRSQIAEVKPGTAHFFNLTSDF